MKVCVIGIYVNDMDIAINFYEEKLGFELQSRVHYPDLVEFKTDNGIPLILTKAEKSTTIDYPNASAVVLCLETQDVQATINDYISKGINLIHESPQPFPGGRFFAFRDPFGNVFEVLEFEK